MPSSRGIFPIPGSNLCLLRLLHWQVDYLPLCHLGSPKIAILCSVWEQVFSRLVLLQRWSLDPEDPLEEGMATHSSIYAWKIPWTEEPGRLQSMGSQRVGHD